MNDEASRIYGYFFVSRNFKKEKLTLTRASHADENHCSLFKACRFFFFSFPQKTLRSHLMILKYMLAMLLCSVTSEISRKKHVSRGEVVGLSPRKLETVSTLFKLEKLVLIVSVSNSNFEFCDVDNFLPISPLYFSCGDTFFDQLYVATSDRIVRTFFVVVKNRKKRAD